MEDVVMNNNSFCTKHEEIEECGLNLPAEEIREKEHPKLRLVEKASQSEPYSPTCFIQPEERESEPSKIFPEQETELYSDPQDGARSPLAIYFKSISRFPLLSDEEEKNLAKHLKGCEEECKNLVIKWKQLSMKELPKVVSSDKTKEIRKKLQLLNSTFHHFDDIIRLERERKKIDRLLKRLGNLPKIKQEFKGKLYKIESEISKRITEVSLSSMNANEIIKNLEEIPISKRYIKKQNTVIKELRETLRGIAHISKEIKILKNELVQSNLRLVISIAKKYVQHSLPLSDLIQEGNLGLIRAIDTYDYRRGHRLITYATWWIRQAIIRALDYQSRTIRTPVYVSEKLNQIVKASKRLQQKLKREPTITEIAQEADTSLESVEKVMQSFKDAVPLDTFIEEEGESPINSYSCYGTSSLLEKAVLSNLSQVMDVTLTDLTQREKEIVKLRFGIGKNHDHTLEEIGWQLDLTRERIRQILDVALNKLRTPEHMVELKDFI